MCPAYHGVDGPDVERHIAQWDGAVHRQLIQGDRLVQEGAQVSVDQIAACKKGLQMCT